MNNQEDHQQPGARDQSGGQDPNASAKHDPANSTGDFDADSVFQMNEAGEADQAREGDDRFETDAQRAERLEQELADANRRLLLAHADVDNTRKRLRRDFEDQLRYANMPLIRDTLTVLDNLQRALAAAQGNEAASGLIEGVAMVAKQLEETLTKHNCKPIPAEGELFDPNYHEAITQIPSEQHPAGVIAQVAVPGYQLHERVVRPSQVIVSTGPAAAEG
ncbi:nucleotide exchange factor GrpE [Planctomycetaceae bacterium SH139]